jgi:endoglucanase
MGSSLLIGVNLAGAEFGSNVPGTFGVDYTYPTHAEIDYYASKGMEVIRLPFLWERLQRTEFGTLDPAELARLDDVVNYATSKGLEVDLDPHDYGYGFGNLIGSGQTPNSAFADFWGKLAAHYASNPNVMFGLMNEPHAQSASTWLVSVNAAISAIRSAGANQEILVPGTYWDGAWTWTTTDNASVIGTGVVDPDHNYAFEVHQYLDSDGSGTHPGVVSATIGVERLTAITQWAEATGNRLFLGEVGVSTDQTSLTALDLMLTYMSQHTDAWQGITYWAGGPWWGNYMFSIEPQNGIDKPQMPILLDHLSSVAPVTMTAQTIQNDYLGITRTALPSDQATTIANSITTGTQTETQYVNSLLSQVADTTLPAVAVEGSMYDAAGTSAEITKLAHSRPASAPQMLLCQIRLLAI